MTTHRSADEGEGFWQLRSFFELSDELDAIFGPIDFEACWCPRCPARRLFEKNGCKVRVVKKKI